MARLVPAIGSDGGDADLRLQRLERAGLIRRPTTKLDVDSFLAGPRARSQESVLEALLEDRRQGDR